MKVLVTDGNFKHTLATVRSLGKMGVEVDVVSDMRCSISFFSKYCHKYYIAPNPQKSGKFIDSILTIIKKEKYDVLLPISFAAVHQISEKREEISKYVNIVLPEKDDLNIALDKGETLKLAEKIGISIPITYYPKSYSEIKRISSEIDYPAVVKGSEESGYVGYANSAGELITQYLKIENHSPIIQEYISGDGYGFFALYNHGEPKTIFMHKRIREYPVTGGPSTCAVSIYDPDLKELGLKLLNSLKWHGVAMVEFKKDARTGKFVLMEINPKFWGSLELAIASGVDFPNLACKMALDGDIDSIFNYQTGVKFRWLLPGDLFHAITNPKNIAVFITDFFDRDILYDIRLNDIKPNIMQIGMTLAEFILRVKEHRFWRAHGQIRR